MSDHVTPPRNEQLQRKSAVSKARAWRSGDLIHGRWFVHRAQPPSEMGQVYFCFDTKPGIPVVVKSLPMYQMEREGVRNGFILECEAWIRLKNHPNIVPALFVELINDVPFVFVEWISGRHIYQAGLDAWLDGAKLSLESIISIVAQVCDGMIYAGEILSEPGMPFVHRDLKPSNILMTRNGIAKITDFGIARTRLLIRNSEQLRRRTGEKSTVQEVDQFLGTPPYMSPEHFLGSEAVDPRSDIYSFGCVIFELLTGRPVFDAQSWEDWRVAHTHRAPPSIKQIRPEVSQRLDDLITACLAKQKSDRPQDFVEIRKYLLSVGIRVQLPISSQMASPHAPAAEGETPDLDGQGSDSDSERATKVHNEQAPDVDSTDVARNEHSMTRVGDTDLMELINIGSSLDALGNPAEAITYYDRAAQILDQMSDDSDKNADELGKNAMLVILASNRALAYDHLKEYNRALAAWDVALKHADRIPSGYRAPVRSSPTDRNSIVTGKASTLAHIGKYDEAIVLCKEVLNNEPNNQVANSHLGWVLVCAGRFKEAIPYCRRAVALDERDAHSWANLGACYGEVGQSGEALNALQRALAITPTLAHALYCMGMEYCAQGEMELGIQYLRRALESNPSYSEAWNNLGVALVMTQQDGAHECFTAALRADPNNTQAAMNLSLLTPRRTASKWGVKYREEK